MDTCVRHYFGYLTMSVQKESGDGFFAQYAGLSGLSIAFCFVALALTPSPERVNHGLKKTSCGQTTHRLGAEVLTSSR